MYTMRLKIMTFLENLHAFFVRPWYSMFAKKFHRTVLFGHNSIFASSIMTATFQHSNTKRLQSRRPYSIVYSLFTLFTRLGFMIDLCYLVTSLEQYPLIIQSSVWAMHKWSKKAKPQQIAKINPHLSRKKIEVKEQKWPYFFDLGLFWGENRVVPFSTFQ